MRRSLLAPICAATIALTTADSVATEPAPVVVRVTGKDRLRVQVSEGLTMPCDSTNNRPLFDGQLGPGETWSTTIGGECVCVRSTVGPFRDVDWTTSGLACRKRVCRGRVCRPDPDPTIRVSLP